jgi:hypothetical protein
MQVVRILLALKALLLVVRMMVKPMQELKAVKFSNLHAYKWLSHDTSHQIKKY